MGLAVRDGLPIGAPIGGAVPEGRAGHGLGVPSVGSQGIYGATASIQSRRLPHSERASAGLTEITGRYEPARLTTSGPIGSGDPPLPGLRSTALDFRARRWLPGVSVRSPNGVSTPG